MHEDYQLAYCPIAHITTLAFADDAFENACLTPELLHKLRVPSRLHCLSLRFKKSMLNTPTFRSTVQTVSGVDTHPIRPMLYRTGNDALKQLGELAGYRYAIHSYCFRRWVANQANRKLNCTFFYLTYLRLSDLSFSPLRYSQLVAKRCGF